MSQTLTRLFVHVVFSTKNRDPLILPRIELPLHRYMCTVSASLESPIVEINGTENHVHFLVSLSKNIALKDLLMQVKKTSSVWVKEQESTMDSFHWQDGYGAFSVSESNVEEVRTYIRNQKEHHRQRSFEEELILMLKKHNLQYDERYLWT